MEGINELNETYTFCKVYDEYIINAEKCEEAESRYVVI